MAVARTECRDQSPKHSLLKASLTLNQGGFPKKELAGVGGFEPPYAGLQPAAWPFGDTPTQIQNLINNC